MKRRTFLGAILAFFGIASVSKAKGIPEYTYDWGNGRVTDDPRFLGVPLPYGTKVQKVFLNGEVVSDSWRIRSCKTGKNGWIKVAQFEADGITPRCDARWNIIEKLETDRVEYVYLG